MDIFQRQHSLIHPMQMDDISLTKLWKTRDIGSAVGNIQFKEMLALQLEMQPYHQTLPQEVPPEAPCLRQCTHGQLLCLLVAHQHFRLDTVIVQGFHQAVGSYSGSARPLTCIDNEYSHTL